MECIEVVCCNEFLDGFFFVGNCEGDYDCEDGKVYEEWFYDIVICKFNEFMLEECFWEKY